MTTCAIPLQAGAPFDAEGVPRQRLTLVDTGVVREVAYGRAGGGAGGRRAHRPRLPAAQ